MIEKSCLNCEYIDFSSPHKFSDCKCPLPPWIEEIDLGARSFIVSDNPYPICKVWKKKGEEDENGN